MGNICGRTQHDEKLQSTSHTDNKSVPTPSTAPAKKLDPKDFILSKLDKQTIVKPADSISGQSFDIEYCTDCTILLCDNSAQVQIDDCTNCSIYIGPCESSIFIRNCNNCKFITASQQLRLRDCKNIDLLIYVSASQPIIESCKHIRISRFQMNYFGLEQQFQAANLSPFNTEYSNVHDFTANNSKQNWSYLPYSTTVTDIISNITEIQNFDYIADTRQFVVPLTYGNRTLLHKGLCEFFILKQHTDLVYKLLDELYVPLKSQQVLLTRTRDTTLTAEQYSTLSGTTTTQSQSVIALEFNVANSNVLNSALKQIDTESRFTSCVDLDVASRILFAPLAQI